MATELSSVKIAVAVRPFNEKEQQDNEDRVVWAQGNEVRVLNPETEKEKVFNFDFTVSLYCCQNEESGGLIRYSWCVHVWSCGTYASLIIISPIKRLLGKLLTRPLSRILLLSKKALSFVVSCTLMLL